MVGMWVRTVWTFKMRFSPNYLVEQCVKPSSLAGWKGWGLWVSLRWYLDSLRVYLVGRIPLILPSSSTASLCSHLLSHSLMDVSSWIPWSQTIYLKKPLQLNNCALFNHTASVRNPIKTSLEVVFYWFARFPATDALILTTPSHLHLIQWCNLTRPHTVWCTILKMAPHTAGDIPY